MAKQATKNKAKPSPKMAEKAAVASKGKPVKKPTKSTKPAKVTKKVAVKVKKPAPAKAKKPAPNKPIKTKKAPPAKKVKATKPAKVKKTAKADKPAKAVKPAKTTKPAKAVKPAKPEKTGKGKKADAPKPKVKTLVLKKVVSQKGDKPVSVRATRGKMPPLVIPKTPVQKPINKEFGYNQPVFPSKNPHSKIFIGLSKQRLLQLKDDLVDSMSGMASETLRSRAQDSEASAFGMHQADAGSDAYDRDFTLSLLSQEQDALYEIEEALKRIVKGTYGICEMSGKTIPVERLEVRPYTRYTVECQEIVDRDPSAGNARRGIRSLFGLGTDEEDEDGDEESVEEEKN